VDLTSDPRHASPNRSLPYYADSTAGVTSSTKPSIYELDFIGAMSLHGSDAGG